MSWAHFLLGEHFCAPTWAADGITSRVTACEPSGLGPKEECEEQKVMWCTSWSRITLEVLKLCIICFVKLFIKSAGGCTWCCCCGSFVDLKWCFDSLNTLQPVKNLQLPQKWSVGSTGECQAAAVWKKSSWRAPFHPAFITDEETHRWRVTPPESHDSLHAVVSKHVNWRMSFYNVDPKRNTHLLPCGGCQRADVVIEQRGFHCPREQCGELEDISPMTGSWGTTTGTTRPGQQFFIWTQIIWIKDQ